MVKWPSATKMARLLTLMLLVVVWKTSGAMPTADEDKAWRQSVLAMCDSPSFKQQKCGFMPVSEGKIVHAPYDNLVLGSMGTCCRGFDGVAFKENNIVEAEIKTYPDGTTGLSMSHNEARMTVSMACTGRFLVRMVFKVLSQPKKSNPAWKDCTFSRLSPGSFESSATPVVRCELELPSGSGSEDARAVAAKETKCYICNLCMDGGGCPATAGKWYSDTFMASSQSSCDDVRSGKLTSKRWDRIHLSIGSTFKMPKFEACSDPSCFDRAYEENKLKRAIKCTNGICPPA